jgi:DNA-binding MarR family transcriptional regulator
MARMRLDDATDHHVSRLSCGDQSNTMSLNELYSKPGHLIRRAHQVSWALFLDECSDYRVTPVQYAALVAIREQPGVDATRLSSLIAFDRATIGDVIDRLEKRKLVTRRQNPGDRRIKLLFLTKFGEDILVKADPAVSRVQKRLLEPLTKKERIVFIKLLTRITTP